MGWRVSGRYNTKSYLVLRFPLVCFPHHPHSWFPECEPPIVVTQWKLWPHDWPWIIKEVSFGEIWLSHKPETQQSPKHNDMYYLGEPITHSIGSFCSNVGLAKSQRIAGERLRLKLIKVQPVLFSTLYLCNPSNFNHPLESIGYSLT